MRNDLNVSASEHDTSINHDVRDTFLSYDSLGDDKIYVNQIGEVLRSLNLNPTESEIKKYAAYYENLDKRISFEDFTYCYKEAKKNFKPTSMEEIVEGLSHFDKEGNGTINVAELRHILTTLGEKLKEDEVDKLMEGYADAQGNIYISKFVQDILDLDIA
uniref:EF-hand domain-containing protein n=1 Tax=Rhabditophanes sp. KR3021 TaxID=114890 RepID=A0AC35TI14_9BILA